MFSHPLRGAERERKRERENSLYLHQPVQHQPVKSPRLNCREISKRSFSLESIVVWFEMMAPLKHL